MAVTHGSGFEAQWLHLRSTGTGDGALCPNLYNSASGSGIRYMGMVYSLKAFIMTLDTSTSRLEEQAFTSPALSLGIHFYIFVHQNFRHAG